MKWSVFSLYILSLFGLSLGQSCMKSSFTGIQTGPRAILASATDTVVAPPPSRELLPMSDYLLTLSTNTNAPKYYTLFGANLYNPGSGTDYTGSELGYAFRSSLKGTVGSLGYNLPATGYNHRVTLWDSASQAILAQIEVSSVGGQFVYQALPTPVTIERNHGYIVSVNTAVKGILVNSASPANQVFSVNGVYENSSQGFQLVPFFPYKDGSISIEGPCLLDYGTMRVSPLPFPGNSLTGDNANEFIGFADIGFL